MALIAVKYMPKASTFFPKLWSMTNFRLGGGLGAVTETLFIFISMGRGVDSLPYVYLLVEKNGVRDRIVYADILQGDKLQVSRAD